MEETEKTENAQDAAREQPQNTGEDFDALIRGRYKKEFDARVQRIVKDRLKHVKEEAPQRSAALTEGQKEQLLREFPDAEPEEEMLAAMVSAGAQPADAYAALHRQALYETLREQAVKEVLQAIRRNETRPPENGLQESAAVFRADPGSLTKEQRRLLRERVRRGEKIRF